LLQFVFIASAISASEVPTNPSKIEKSHRFAKKLLKKGHKFKENKSY
jgi:hypothetical protein